MPGPSSGPPAHSLPAGALGVHNAGPAGLGKGRDVDKMTFEIQGLQAVKLALRSLEPKLAAKVFRKAERKSAKLFAEAIKSRVPVESGLLRDTIKVRSSKGPRGSGRGSVSIAVLVGQGGAGKDKAKQEAEEKAKIAFYAFMQERGFTVGKRHRATLLGISAQWHTRAAGNLGSQGVRHIPGKHFVRDALHAREEQARETLVLEILEGIETVVGKS